jgi:hypothetical protein
MAFILGQICYKKWHVFFGKVLGRLVKPAGFLREIREKTNATGGKSGTEKRSGGIK